MDDCKPTSAMETVRKFALASGLSVMFSVLPTLEAQAQTIVDPAGTFATGWLVGDFQNVTLGAASNVSSSAEIKPFAVDEPLGAGTNSTGWDLTTFLSFATIDPDKVDVYMPEPTITMGPGSNGIAVSAGAGPLHIFGNSGTAAPTATPGVLMASTKAGNGGTPGDGYYTMSFSTPLTAIVKPNAATVSADAGTLTVDVQ